MFDTERPPSSNTGGQLLIDENELAERINNTKAYVFDWDGVFNDGVKNTNGSSSFSDIDSMGVNMMRFCHFLRTGSNPISCIITGENNVDAFTFAKRESFHSVYYGVKTKTEALQHLCDSYGLKPSEITFFFDDILDLCVAKLVGTRIMCSRKCNPLLNQYVIERGMADYITQFPGGEHAVREATELLIGATGLYDAVLDNRVANSEAYRTYLAERNAHQPAFYTVKDSEIIKQ